MAESLEQKIQKAGGALKLLRSPRSGLFPFPIKSEFTNWRDEQESWRKAAVLFDQSHHMLELHVEGPDTYRLLSDLGVNTFKNFGPMRAKQFVACNHEGYIIGDSILFCEKENHVVIVGRPPAHNWVEFHAKTGGYDVQTRRDERTVMNKQGREKYRYQVQGPNAEKIFEKINGGPLPEVSFFGMLKFKIGDHEVTGLNHRMSGFPGLEFWGPASEGEAVRDYLLKAGEEFGLTQAGAKTYSSVASESGWVAGTTPAIYSGDKMKPYREWANGMSFEGNLVLGGSFVSEKIEDYYQTPWDVGYGHVIKFDHDFIGREALEQKVKESHRKKVWLYWEREDVAKVFASLYEEGNKRFKFIDMPSGWYSSLPFDRIERDGELIGLSTMSIYSSNVRGFLSLSMIDEGKFNYGDEVELVWGEPDGGSSNPAVERHTQTKIRAKVGPKPFSDEKGSH